VKIEVTEIGIDIVSVDKLRTLWENHRDRLLNDIFSARELSAIADHEDGAPSLPEHLSNRQLRYLGTRFAAKEAAVKALGIPYRVAFNWCDIEVIGSEIVEIQLHGDSSLHALRLGIKRLVGSTASTDSTCLAMIMREL
jgi:holo-[acyl-carrier protein] synthase